MYNRYIPQPDGSYRKDRIPDAPINKPQEPPRHEHREQTCPPPPPPPPKPEPEKPKHQSAPQHQTNAGDFLRQLLPKNLDTGDLMIILLLLLMAGDCQEDRNTALLTLAIYLFM